MVNFMKLLALMAGIALLNILVLSPGFIGIRIGESPLATAAGVTLLVASALALLYGIYVWLFKPPATLPVKQVKTHEDYVGALMRFRRSRAVGNEIGLALDQLDRIRKKKDTLMNVLNQRFDPGELSYKKFASAIYEVEKLFYLNVRSVLNRLDVFDEADFERVMSQRTTPFARDLLQEKRNLYGELLHFVRSSLETNEEILLKLHKLLIEVSRLNSFEPGDIENMPCMKEIDMLIKQTKYYK
ncbi:hypothetical protein ACF3MZ_11895 [Paenibacillaceae bacterium WGS1546]|uniref:hypothetical protein n=1 Tax=Cohnella sp. WGS1546 TaxID=3366810 RepID=UPI00372CFC54